MKKAVYWKYEYILAYNDKVPKSNKVYHISLNAVQQTAYFWPLEPEFAASNPAEAVGFFGSPENPQYSFLQRGSKRICPMSQLCGM